MVKDAAISIRVEPKLKAQLEKFAGEHGMTLTAYAVKILAAHSGPPQWKLDDIEVVHTMKAGTTIKMNIAVGWPIALLSPDKALALGAELVKAANTATKLAK